ncbi:MAG TPA: hypothetical protein PLC98_24745 [Anaerolineales bacterium]|nr:hypothetical protein [Anaerolineales bacterium]
MPPVITPRTARILSERALYGHIDPEVVDWAVALLDEDFDSPSVRQLAALLAPLNPFEVAELRDRVLVELGLENIGRDQAVLLQVQAILAKAVLGDGRSVSDAYAEVDSLYMRSGYMIELADLSQVHWARLELDDGPDQWSWDGAHRENIDQIMREEASRFLQEFAETFDSNRSGEFFRGAEG